MKIYNVTYFQEHYTHNFTVASDKDEGSLKEQVEKELREHLVPFYDVKVERMEKITTETADEKVYLKSTIALLEKFVEELDEYVDWDGLERKGCKAPKQLDYIKSHINYIKRRINNV